MIFPVDDQGPGPPIPMITVKAYAVLLNSDRTHHAVWVGHDPSKTPQHFHRLLGGHVEFGERAAEAAVREIGEELGAELSTITLLDVVESIFVYEGTPGHEVVFVYAGELAADVVADEGGWFADNDAPIRVEWRPVAATTDLPLYPDGTQRLIDAYLRSG